MPLSVRACLLFCAPLRWSLLFTWVYLPSLAFISLYLYVPALNVQYSSRSCPHYVSHTGDIHYGLTNMFHLAFILSTAKTISWVSRHVSTCVCLFVCVCVCVCVCARAHLHGWLAGCIIGSAGTLLLSHAQCMCVRRRGRGRASERETSQEIQTAARSVATKWRFPPPVTVTKTTLC